MGQNVDEGIFHGVVLGQGTFYIQKGEGTFTIDCCRMPRLGRWNDRGGVWGSMEDKHEAVHGVKGEI